MSQPDTPAPGTAKGAAASREERLAARLRDNLRRRKAQARALATADPARPAGEDGGAERASDPAPGTPDDALSKSPTSG